MTRFSGPYFPRALRTPRLRAPVAVIAGLTLCGVIVGGLWAWIAPPVHGVVALTRGGQRVHDYLGNEADHFFVAAFLLLGLLGVVAVVAPVLVWQWRVHRGPGMVIGLLIGLTGAAAAAAAVGVVVVRHRYGSPDLGTVPLSADDPVSYFVQAPPVFFGHTSAQVAATLLLPAALATLVYALPVAATARDDLGAGPVAESDQPPGEAMVAAGEPGEPSDRAGDSCGPPQTSTSSWCGQPDQG